MCATTAQEVAKWLMHTEVLRTIDLGDGRWHTDDPGMDQRQWLAGV